MWCFDGVSLSLDLMDWEVAARYRACVKGLRAMRRGTPGEGLCVHLRAFFDALFGEGTGIALLGMDADDARALRCGQSFLAYGQAQREAALLWADALWRYAPERAAGWAVER